MFFMVIEDNDDIEKVMRLYYRYRKLLYKEACLILEDKQLSEDAVQETYEKVIKNLHKINENNDANTRNYLATICRNTAKDIKKKSFPLNKCDKATEHMASSDSEEIPDALDIIIKRESVAEIAEAIEELDDIYRDVFIMRRVQNHTRKEIAEILNINIETVKKRLTRAKAKIIQNLNRRGQDV